MTFKSKFLSFMTKVNPSNENETKSDIFLWCIFTNEIFQLHDLKINPNNEHDTNSNIFSRDIFKSDIIFFLSKNIQVFQ